MLNHQLLKDASTPSFNKIELIKRYSARYDRDMPIELGIHAEIADSYHLRGDHNRQYTGGGHKPVGYSQGGIPSGEHELQHGLDRNTCSVLSETLGTPDNFWSFLIFIRVTIMIALSTGINTPTHTFPLSYTDTPTGIIAYQNALPVAWIVAGYHTGSLNNQPHTCTFVDVAYTRKTFHGINLETFDADSVEQAKQALEVLFSDLPHSTKQAQILSIFATPTAPTQPLNTTKLKATPLFTALNRLPVQGVSA